MREERKRDRGEMKVGGGKLEGRSWGRTAVIGGQVYLVPDYGLPVPVLCTGSRGNICEYSLIRIITAQEYRNRRLIFTL